MRPYRFGCSLYLRKGIVYVVTQGYDSGLWVEIEPVSMVPLSNGPGLHQAIKETIERGSPVIYIRPGAPPDAVVPKYAGMKSWSAFVRGAASFSIEQERNGRYAIQTYKKMTTGRGLEPDSDQTVTLPSDTDIDRICDQVIEIIRKQAESSA